MIEKKDIEKLAELARIGLSEKEKDNLLREVSGILVYVDQIKNAPIDMKAESRVGSVKNIMRDDEILNKSGENTDVLLKESPKSEKGSVKVKKILNGGES